MKKLILSGALLVSSIVFSQSTTESTAIVEVEIVFVVIQDTVQNSITVVLNEIFENEKIVTGPVSRKTHNPAKLEAKKD
jgi:hypothetical protein